MSRRSVALVLCIFLCGCGGMVRSTSLRTQPGGQQQGEGTDSGTVKKDPPGSGLVYFLPKAMLRLKILPIKDEDCAKREQNSDKTTVTVNVYNNASQSSENKDKSAGAPFISFSYTDADKKTKQVTTDLFYTVDPDAAYSLHYIGNAAYDDEINFVLKDNFLSEITSSADDKTKEIAKQGVEVIKQVLLAGTGLGLKSRASDAAQETGQEGDATLYPTALEVDFDPRDLLDSKYQEWCSTVESRLVDRQSAMLRRALGHEEEAFHDDARILSQYRIEKNKQSKQKEEADRKAASSWRALKEVTASRDAEIKNYEARCKTDTPAQEDICDKIKKDLDDLEMKVKAEEQKQKDLSAEATEANRIYSDVVEKYNKQLEKINAARPARAALVHELKSLRNQSDLLRDGELHISPPPTLLASDFFRHNIAVCLKRTIQDFPAGASPTEASADGVYYRAAFPYKITMLVWQDAQVVRKIERIIMLPNESPRYFYDMKRAGLAKKTYNLKFENGFLTSAKITKTSELLAGISLPADLLKGIASIPAELIQLKINYNSNQQALLDAQKAQFDSLKSFNQSILEMYQNNAAQMKAITESKP